MGRAPFAECDDVEQVDRVEDVGLVPGAMLTGKRIAFVLSSRDLGTRASSLPATVRLLRRHGSQVRVYPLEPTSGCERLDPAIHASAPPRGDRFGHGATLRSLDRAVRGWRPDLLWTSGTRATLLGQLVGGWRHIPVVTWHDGVTLGRVERRVLRATRTRSALWIGASDFAAEHARDQLVVAPATLAVWPSLIVEGDVPVARPWRPGEPVRIGARGALHRANGFDVLLTALSILKNIGVPHAFSVEIAGDGPQAGVLELFRTVDRLDTVSLVGGDRDPRAFLAGLHLYVQPSRVGDFCEAVPEAMAAGLPVIGTSVGALPHLIVDGSTGVIVPPDNPSALVGALAVSLRHPQRLEEMGKLGRARIVDRFGSAAFTRAGEAVIARIRSEVLSPG